MTGTQRGTKTLQGPHLLRDDLGEEIKTIVLAADVAAPAAEEDTEEVEDEEGIEECTLPPPEEEAVL